MMLIIFVKLENPEPGVTLQIPNIEKETGRHLNTRVLLSDVGEVLRFSFPRIVGHQLCQRSWSFRPGISSTNIAPKVENIFTLKKHKTSSTTALEDVNLAV